MSRIETPPDQRFPRSVRMPFRSRRRRCGRVREPARRPGRSPRALVALALLLAAGPLAAQGLALVPERPVAPALRLAGLDGERHDLAALRGQVVLVSFWATWCPPCREEMPSMARLARQLGAGGLRVLAVDAGETAGAVREFLAELGVELGFPVLLDPRMEAFASWAVRGLPTSFVVGREGRIRYRAEGAQPFDSAVIRARLTALLEEQP